MKRNCLLLSIFSLVSLFLSSCDSNEEVKDLTLPTDLVVIESNYLSSYLNLSSITIGKNIKEVHGSAFANCRELENVYYDGTILDWCSIKFQNAKSNPMFFATNFYILQDGQYQLLNDIEIPNNISEIKEFTFAGFDIDKFTFSSSLNKFGENAFKNATVSDIYYKGKISDWCKIEFDNFTSTPVNENSNVFMYDANDSYYLIDDTLLIPSDVEIISDYQFANFSSIDQIILSSNIKNIGKYAFVLKKDIKDKIKSLHYNGTISQWMNIVFEGRFSNPMELSERIYMLNESKEYYEITSLDSIRLSDDVTKLGDYQLAGIQNFENLYFSNSVKEINENVFGTYDVIIDNIYFAGSIKDWCEIDLKDKYTIAYDANNIYFMENDEYYLAESELIIPSEVEVIKNNQFSGFKKVNTFVVSENITSIGDNCFANCYGLERIVLPTSLTSIGNDFISGCGSLSGIFYLGTSDSWNQINKPNISVNVYYYSENEPEDSGNYWHYVDEKITIWE